MCKSIYIILFGALEIGLCNGHVYLEMDIMGRGSIIGMDRVLTGKEWSYEAKIKSKLAHIIQIPIEVLQSEMKMSPLLLDKMQQYHSNLL